MIRPAPLKLKYDNRFPLPVPSARKPKMKETFFQKLYKANWRNAVVGVAGLNAIRFAFGTYNAFQDSRVDEYAQQPRLVTVSIALCVMYAISCVIEVLGVIGISMQRLLLVRGYVFFEFLSALLVTATGILGTASFFLNAEDLMYECVALAITGQVNAKSQFRSHPWHSIYSLNLRQAQKQCVTAWTHESWTQVINVFLFAFVPAVMCHLMVYTYYRQTIDATHNAYLAPARLEISGSAPQQNNRHGGYSRVPNVEIHHAGSPRRTNNRIAPVSPRHRAGRRSAIKAGNGPNVTSTATTAGTNSFKRAHRPPALIELEGPIFTPQRGVVLKSGSPLSFIFSPGPPSFGVNIVGPSRFGIGAYGSVIDHSCSGGSVASACYSKFA